MKRVIKITVLIFVGILFVIGFLVYQIILISKPTHGNKIDKYPSPQTAVLVIDIQEDFTGSTARPPFPYKNSEKLISTVNRIIETSSQKNINIIYIRQELDGFLGKSLSKLFGGGTAIKGNPGTEIDNRVLIKSGNIFPKPRSDAFSNSEFENFLIQHHINELYLVGLDAAGCVHTTAQGALNRGYMVNIITDSIVLLEEKKWEELMKCYQEEGIRLLSSDEFLEKSL